jgi:hypothetical protein
MSNAVMIPLSYHGEVVAHAKVDDDVAPKVLKHKWFHDPVKGTAYRCEQHGESKKFFMLHREVLDAPVGTHVKALDGNRLNCTGENLRAVQGLALTGGRYFPARADSLRNYFSRHHPALSEILEAGEIEQYGKRRISIAYEHGSEEAKRAKHHSFREVFEAKLKEELNFPGELHIFERIEPEAISINRNSDMTKQSEFRSWESAGRFALDMRNNGQDLATVAKALNDRGYRHKTGSLMTAETTATLVRIFKRSITCKKQKKQRQKTAEKNEPRTAKTSSSKGGGGVIDLLLQVNGDDEISGEDKATITQALLKTLRKKAKA